MKGVHLEGLRVLGKPQRFARHYYEAGAYELIYQDVVASLYGRNSLLHIVERTSREIFVPLTVGGGLRSLEDIRDILRAGADKVSLNTAALDRPELISEAANAFGSSTIVISIEAKERPDASYECYTDNGRIRTKVNALEWAQRVEELGAGEILLTSIDREGTGTGYDTALTRAVSESVSIPVIACGGAGTPAHVIAAATEGLADAVSIASVLHYGTIRDMEHDDDYSDEGNITFLKEGGGFSRVQPASVGEVKAACHGAGVPCRWNPKEGANA